ncbi:hypothetical protein CAT7_00080 [Carnobacterium sp. AT7]|uniref:hypothetical protein n=2 Tax=Carnobacteriaceae TaxID=186828 RepID=UPI00015EF6F1|nr:hypothetical protein [Carnobacterium sp. AT7]EDP67808.1 hypothetical protein CAT7_00080 [Carnobacterium sp. AT7]
MDKCEIALSNGKSLVVNSSTEQLLNKATDEDGELLESFILLEDESGASYYLNPNQIVTVSVFETDAKEDTDKSEVDSEGKHTKGNLDAVKNLSKDIENME